MGWKADLLGIDDLASSVRFKVYKPWGRIEVVQTPFHGFRETLMLYPLLEGNHGHLISEIRMRLRNKNTLNSFADRFGHKKSKHKPFHLALSAIPRPFILGNIKVKSCPDTQC